jgi:hypothetical protein
MSRRCTICVFPQVAEIDALLTSGSAVRQVARIYGLPRTTLGRHSQHMAPTGKKFAVIRGQDGPTGPPDPLVEALALAGRARTPRERLRALEQVRAATKLKLRGIGDPDTESLELLDHNIAQAEAAYTDAPDFETAARALSGWREAILQRLDAVTAPDAIEIALVVAFSDGRRFGETVFRMQPEHYWSGVPVRFRDSSKYAVERRIELAFLGGEPGEEVKVREIATGAIAWVHRTPKRALAKVAPDAQGGTEHGPH